MVELPKFNTARGDAIVPQSGPFDLNGVNVLVFPLRANLHRLQKLCDQYFDIDCPDVFDFRVSTPYVFLFVAHYGRMESHVRDIGWWSQNEVGFGLLLDWYRWEGNRMVFHDWAMFTPYVFVDDTVSITTGREVYGWPKVRAWFNDEPLRRIPHPRARERVLKMETRMFASSRAGQRLAKHALLEIHREPPFNISQFPPDLDSSPLAVLPRAVLGGATAMGSIAQAVTQMLRGSTFLPDDRKLATILDRFIRSVPFASPDLYLNDINFKQFRDCEQTNHAIYRAVISARLSLTRYNSSGLLGDFDQLRGDPSAGYTVDICRHAGQPIVDTLGLVISKREVRNGTSVDILKPRIPFWLDIDIHYGLGERLAWSEGSSGWLCAGDGTSSCQPRGYRGDSDGSLPLYVSTGGVVREKQDGPFEMKESTVRVFPIDANIEKLEEFCEKYLNVAKDITQFHAIGNRVLVLVITYNRLSPAVQDVGWWAEQEVLFVVPAMWTMPGQDDQVVMVAPYNFVNRSIAVATGREINGWPKTNAELGEFEDPWMSVKGPLGNRRLLVLKTSVFERAYSNRRQEYAPFLEIEKDGPGAARSTYKKASVIDDVLEDENYDEALLDAFAALRGGHHPMSFINLKQFRDAADPQRACYQAIVRSNLTMSERVGEGYFDDAEHRRRNKSAFSIRLHQYPNQPIHETLGLVHEKETTEEDGIVVHTLRPADPFWFRADLKYELGERICWRTREKPWITK